MIVTFRTLQNPVISASGIRGQVIRFDAGCTAPDFSGEVYLSVLRIRTDLSSGEIARRVIDRPLDLPVIFTKAHDFRRQEVPFRSSVTAVGPRGIVDCHGQIVSHMHTGEGSIFTGGRMEFVIDQCATPPENLEVEEGTWVSFRAEGFGFWMT